MTDKEVMQMALTAFEVATTHFSKDRQEIQAAIKALAQPEKEWVGLTDEDKKAIYEQADIEGWHDRPLLEAVEAKLKEKNT